MINPIWSVLATIILTDKISNGISYVQCVEQITTNKLPVGLPRMAIGTSWERDSDDIEILKLRIEIEHPSGEKSKIIEGEHPMAQKRLRANIDITGMEIKETGRHVLHIDYLKENSWAMAFEIPFQVILIKQTSTK